MGKNRERVPYRIPIRVLHTREKFQLQGASLLCSGSHVSWTF